MVPTTSLASAKHDINKPTLPYPNRTPCYMYLVGKLGVDRERETDRNHISLSDEEKLAEITGYSQVHFPGLMFVHKWT